MDKKKVSKWDLKKAAKLLQIDFDSNEQKILQLAGLTESTESVDKEEEPVENNAKDRVAFGIVQEGKDFLVVKMRFNLNDAEIAFKTDMEARAVLDRNRLEAEEKSLEYRKKRREVNR